ncbi:TPA: EAL domain-containing protein [Klebsiella quasipneumoniae subsp. similipneumoniae]|nr:EAL domain-containing protein [Klebsiella quasipneumoniae subsp. similipneumoniae]
MHIKKIFLLTDDNYLYLGMRNILSDLVFIDLQSIFHPVQTTTSNIALFIDNRLPAVIVNNWLEANNLYIANVCIFIVRMSDAKCINRGYETYKYIDAKLHLSDFTLCLNKILSPPFLLNRKLQYLKFNLSELDADLLNIFSGKTSIESFCNLYSVTIKKIYKLREGLVSRFGLDNFNELVVFLHRNQFLSQNIETDLSISPNKMNVKIASRNNDTTPYYQPIINGCDKICGMEITIHEKGEMCYETPQGTAYSLVNSKNLSNEMISCTMVKTAIDISATKSIWKNEFYVLFNVSQANLNNPLFYWDCVNFIESTNKSSLRLVIGVTNKFNKSMRSASQEMIKALKRKGTIFILSDFGSDFADLSYLGERCFDAIKIGKEFIREINKVEQHIPILESMIGLIRSLDLKIIAEDVNDENQKQWLINKQVDYQKGSYIFPAVKFTDFVKYIKNHI